MIKSQHALLIRRGSLFPRRNLAHVSVFVGIVSKEVSPLLQNRRDFQHWLGCWLLVKNAFRSYMLNSSFALPPICWEGFTLC